MPTHSPARPFSMALVLVALTSASGGCTSADTTDVPVEGLDGGDDTSRASTDSNVDESAPDTTIDDTSAAETTVETSVADTMLADTRRPARPMPAPRSRERACSSPATA